MRIIEITEDYSCCLPFAKETSVDYGNVCSTSEVRTDLLSVREHHINAPKCKTFSIKKDLDPLLTSKCGINSISTLTSKHFL